MVGLDDFTGLFQPERFHDFLGSTEVTAAWAAARLDLQGQIHPSWASWPCPGFEASRQRVFELYTMKI